MSGSSQGTRSQTRNKVPQHINEEKMNLDDIEKSSISSENDFQRIHKTFNIGENNDGFTKVLNRKLQRKENKQKRATPIIDNRQLWETYQQQGPFRLNLDNLEMGDKEPITKKQKPNKEFEDVIIDTEMELTDQQQISQNDKTAKLPKKDDNQNAKGKMIQDDQIDLSEEKRLERKEYSIKLCGLPSNTTARDIQSFIEEVNAATFFIPKKPKGYQPLKYAYINFYSQEDLETATSNIYQYKGNQLEWVPADEKSCNICGYTNHMAIECDYQLKQNKSNNRYLNRKNKLKEIKGYNFNRNRNRTYADVTKSNNRNNQFKGRSNSLQF
ncbi:hypothetical protein GLOIN_2v1811259 [Rhizophagus clarus]|uniref:RRM domain-containing protein n=1 Tax=Rhizophagus clarus TaxID=94130 RepID=A0A8H3KXJ7_9GLOM|nr:hypothetical protein GLOIN_2v1811259 [Rhizophagus clarus]